jgi:putative ABC transport system permease protein
MMSSMLLETIRLGIKNLRLHLLRSILTTLGIICGVAAVICMLSITEGASEAEMALIQLLGTENVIVRSIKPKGGSDVGQELVHLLDYGLKQTDLKLMRHTLPSVRRVVPLREVAFTATHGPTRMPVRVVGTEPAFFQTVHVDIAEGRPLEEIDEADQAKVCVIGDDVRRQLFAFEDPLGQTLTADDDVSGLIPYEIVGVLERVEVAGTPAVGIGGRNLNIDVFIPLSTADSRYGDLRIQRSSGSSEYYQCEYSDFYVQVADIEAVEQVARMVEQILDHGHDKTDYEVKVPLERLKIAQNEKFRRRVTLGCIAGISLLVGGIGIMNIMLATVTERTREIGIRRALGAKRYHITIQFLIEAVVLTTMGGLIGIIGGWAGAVTISRLVNWPTVIHPWTVGVSFGLAVAVGIFFGIYPAASAARLDPIEALRHE